MWIPYLVLGHSQDTQFCTYEYYGLAPVALLILCTRVGDNPSIYVACQVVVSAENKENDLGRDVFSRSIVLAELLQWLGTVLESRTFSIHFQPSRDLVSVG